MTDDEKKALIVVGAVAVIGAALYLSGRTNPVPPGATIGPTLDQATPASGTGPLYTNYNVPPAGQQASTIYPPNAIVNPATGIANDNIPYGGCCSGNDGCFTAGGINTGNAPTSLGQLFNWYQNTPNGQSFVKNFEASMVAFDIPPQTIMEQTSPPVAKASNTVF